MLKHGYVRILLSACALMTFAGGLVQAIASANPSTFLPQPQDPSGNYEGPTGPELSLEAVNQIALRLALNANEPNPTDVAASRGSFAAAQAVMDPYSASPSTPTDPELAAWLDSSAFLVVMHGRFTPPMPHPSGYAAPSGTAMGLIIDAHTGFIEGRYVGSYVPDLSKLGTVVQLGNQPIAEAATTRHFQKRKTTFRSAIVGRVLVGGGKHPHNGIQRSHAAPGYLVFVTGPSGNIRRSKVKIILTTRTKADGSFSIPIKPGRYQVGSKFPSGQYCSISTVTVRAGRHPYVGIGCSAK
jgi:hypothetical protein